MSDRTPRRFALWFPLRTDDVLYLRPRALLDVPPEHAHNDLSPIRVARFDGFAVRAGVVWGLRRARPPLQLGPAREQLERWTVAHQRRPLREFVPEVALYEALRAPGSPSRTDGADPTDFVLSVGIASLSEMVSAWGWYVVPVPCNQTEGARFLLPQGPEVSEGTTGPVLLRVGVATLRTLDGKDLAVVLDASESDAWEALLGEAGPAWKPLRVVDRRAEDAASAVNQLALLPGATTSPQAFGAEGAADPTADLAAGGGPRWWFVGANSGAIGQGPDPEALRDRTRRRVVPLSSVESGRIVSARDSSNGRWYVGERV